MMVMVLLNISYNLKLSPVIQRKFSVKVLLMLLIT